jgi:hypothetical protein
VGKLGAYELLLFTEAANEGRLEWNVYVPGLVAVRTSYPQRLLRLLMRGPAVGGGLPRATSSIASRPMAARKALISQVNLVSLFTRRLAARSCIAAVDLSVTASLLSSSTTMIF